MSPNSHLTGRLRLQFVAWPGGAPTEEAYWRPALRLTSGGRAPEECYAERSLRMEQSQRGAALVSPSEPVAWRGAACMAWCSPHGVVQPAWRGAARMAWCSKHGVVQPAWCAASGMRPTTPAPNRFRRCLYHCQLEAGMPSIRTRSCRHGSSCIHHAPARLT